MPKPLPGAGAPKADARSRKRSVRRKLRAGDLAQPTLSFAREPELPFVCGSELMRRFAATYAQHKAWIDAEAHKPRAEQRSYVEWERQQDGDASAA